MNGLEILVGPCSARASPCLPFCTHFMGPAVPLLTFPAEPGVPSLGPGLSMPTFFHIRFEGPGGPCPCQPLYVPPGPSASTQCPSHLFWTHISHTHSEDAALVCHMAVHLVIHLLHALTVAWHTHDHPCTLGPPFQTSHRSPHMSLAARPTSWPWLSPSYAQPKCLHAFTHSLTPRVHSYGLSTPLAYLTHLACMYILSLTLCHLHMPLTHLSPQPCPCPGGPPAHTHIAHQPAYTLHSP